MKIFLAYIVFLISLTILVGLSILYTQRFRDLTRYSNEVERTHGVIIELNNASSYLKDAETGARGFLLSRDSSFLNPYYEALDSIKPTFEKIYRLLEEDNTSQRKKLDALNILMKERLEILDHSMLMFLYNRAIYKSSLQRGRQKMNECRALIKEMTEAEYRSLLANQKTKAFYELVTPGIFLSTIGFTAIAFILSFYVIIREYTSRLKYQKDLEQKMIALDQSYRELEQIAYVSSHDLQEPLRKISTFCDRLVMKHAQQVDEEGRSIIGRINHSAIRMRELVEVLANYTSLVTGGKKKENVDLQFLITVLRQKFSDSLVQKNTTMNVHSLPSVKGYGSQIQLLLECLIDNSIKYSKPDTPLVITISKATIKRDESASVKSRTARSIFTKIVYEDNGIGFDNEFAEKIFSIFRRLHTTEIDGKGVGLAIVKRVMANHNGFVQARGKPNDGAQFLLYFPEDD
jgi:signal transduction histidine kinase